MADDLFDIYDDAFGDDDHPTTLTNNADDNVLDDPFDMMGQEEAVTASGANTNKSAATDTTNPTEDDMFDDFGGLEPTTATTNKVQEGLLEVKSSSDMNNKPHLSQNEKGLGLVMERDRLANTSSAVVPLSESSMALLSLPGSITSFSNTMSSPSMSTTNAVALYVGDLTWWTSEEQLRKIAEQVGVKEEDIKDVIFQEHRNNGKSKGVAYIQLTTTEAAKNMKTALETSQIEGTQPSVVLTTYTGNPFRGGNKTNKGQRHGGNTMGLSMPTSLHHSHHHNTMPNFRMAHNSRSMGTGGNSGSGNSNAVNTASNNPASNTSNTAPTIGSGLPANPLAAAYVNQANYFAQSQMMMGAQQFAAAVAAAASVATNQPIQPPSSTSPHAWMSSGISPVTSTTTPNANASTNVTPNANINVNASNANATASMNTANQHTQRGNKMNTSSTQQHVNSNQSNTRSNHRSFQNNHHHQYHHYNNNNNQNSNQKKDDMKSTSSASSSSTHTKSRHHTNHRDSSYRSQQHHHSHHHSQKHQGSGGTKRRATEDAEHGGHHRRDRKR